MSYPKQRPHVEDVRQAYLRSQLMNYPTPSPSMQQDRNPVSPIPQQQRPQGSDGVAHGSTAQASFPMTQQDRAQGYAAQEPFPETDEAEGGKNGQMQHQAGRDDVRMGEEKRQHAARQEACTNLGLGDSLGPQQEGDSGAFFLRRAHEREDRRAVGSSGRAGGVPVRETDAMNDDDHEAMIATVVVNEASPSYLWRAGASSVRHAANKVSERGRCVPVCVRYAL